MSQAKVRFIHTSDWLLETPLGGVADLPTELHESLLDAPFVAAERVIQAAIEHQVDFVLATGDLLPIETASPYTFEFLLRQWERLAEHKIAMYWLAGPSEDFDLWPAALPLPSHVHCFRMGEMQTYHHQRDGRIVVQLTGRSERKVSGLRAGDYTANDGPIPSIAAYHGEVPKRSLENKGIEYWALGGQIQREILMQGKTGAAYAGSPQGRRPTDLGAHGGLLVQLDYASAEIQPLDTDVWRWRRETMDASTCQTVEQLQSQLQRAWQQIPSDNQRFGWLITWTATCSRSMARALHTDGGLEWVRRSLVRQADDARWTVGLDLRAVDLPQELWEEDSIVGDYLRTVRRFEQDGESWRELLQYLPEGEHRAQWMHEFAKIFEKGSADEVQQMWREVAVWGADLLQGETVMELGRRT